MTFVSFDGNSLVVYLSENIDGMINFTLREKSKSSPDFYPVHVEQFNITGRTAAKQKIQFEYSTIIGFTYKVSYKMYKVYPDGISEHVLEETFNQEFVGKIAGSIF